MSAVPERPIFSVITPVYNGADYIERSYHMLVAQTLSSWEWIVVDDGSTDGTANKVRAIDDARVRLLSYAENRGRGYARTRALEAACGEWMVVWDVDDLYCPDRLERLDQARRSGYDFCCSYAAVVDNSLRVKGVRGFLAPVHGLPRYFVHHTLGCRLGLARQIGYDPSFHTGEDPTLVWVLSARWRGEFVTDALTVYVEEREISAEKAIRSHRARLIQLYRAWRRQLFPLSALQWIALSIAGMTKIAVLHLIRLVPPLYRATLGFRPYGEVGPDYVLPAHRLEFIRRIGELKYSVHARQ